MQTIREFNVNKAENDAISALVLINAKKTWDAALYMLEHQPNTVNSILSGFKGSKTSTGIYEKEDAYQDALESLHRNLENGYFYPMKLLVSDLHLDKAYTSKLISEELRDLLLRQEKAMNQNIESDDMEWVYQYANAIVSDLNESYERDDISWSINSNYAYAAQALREASTKGQAFNKNVSVAYLKKSKAYAQGKYKPKKESTIQNMEIISNKVDVYISALSETNEALERNIKYAEQDFSDALCDSMVTNDVLDLFIKLGGRESNVDAFNAGKAIKGRQQKAMFAISMIKLGLIQKNNLPSTYADAIERFLEDL